MAGRAQTVRDGAYSDKIDRVGGFCLLVELHLEGYAPSAYAAGLFLQPFGLI